MFGKLEFLSACLGLLLSSRAAAAGYDLTVGNMPWVAANEWKDSRVESNGYTTTASGLRYRMLPRRRRSKGTNVNVNRGDHVVVLYKLFLSTEMDDGVAGLDDVRCAAPWSEKSIDLSTASRFDPQADKQLASFSLGHGRRTDGRTV